MAGDELPDRESEREYEGEREYEVEQRVWTRLRGWSKEHRKPLLLLSFAVTAAALGARGRGAGSTGSVTESVTTVGKAAVDAAAEASERVYSEFQALGREYNLAAMDQTVGQAIRRHQRWTPEEVAVLRDTGKTALEKALELGRTYNGVGAKAIKEGASSKVP
ncbi:hypothetical protein [uncultured Nocardioides sp.]|uniref:hypothetical protein n=1 Tax=uncultured Nocardioides sp. TaxID=198441 RepID=UPI0026108411|nr:hypothetical protein [uncultured Nocardioides sp.]